MSTERIDSSRFLPLPALRREARSGRTNDILASAQLMITIPAIFALTRFAIKGGENRVNVQGTRRKAHEKPTPGADGFISAHELLAYDMESEIDEDARRRGNRSPSIQEQEARRREIEELMKPDF